jgi:hypothetical protein
MGLKNRNNITLSDISAYKNAFEKPGALTAALNYYRSFLVSFSFSFFFSLSDLNSNLQTTLCFKIFFRNLIWTRWEVWRKKIPAEIPVMVLWGLDDAALGTSH